MLCKSHRSWTFTKNIIKLIQTSKIQKTTTALHKALRLLVNFFRHWIQRIHWKHLEKTPLRFLMNRNCLKVFVQLWYCTIHRLCKMNEHGQCKINLHNLQMMEWKITIQRHSTMNHLSNWWLIESSLTLPNRWKWGCCTTIWGIFLTRGERYY